MPIYEEYPDYRAIEEAQEQQDFNGETLKLEEDIPMIYPEGFKVISARDFGSNYKQVHLEDEKGQQHTVLVFDSYCDYDKLQEGNYVDGWIRIKDSKFNLVDYCKPESKLLDGEVFISSNGTVYSK